MNPPVFQHQTFSRSGSGRIPRAFSLLVLAIVAICVVQATSDAFAAEFTVNSTVDAPDALPGDGICATSTGECTLRAAVMESNALPGTDTLILASSALYSLSLGPSDSGVGESVQETGDLDITESLILLGNGSTIDAAGIDRVLDLHDNPSTPVLVRIEDLSLTGGQTVGNSLAFGGGVNVRGCSLELIRCTVSLNTAEANGGGIAVNSVFFPDPAPAVLQMTDCTVWRNEGQNGGGIYAAGAQLLLDRCVVWDNRSTGTAGGGGVFVTSDPQWLDLQDSRVAVNEAQGGGGGLTAAAGTTIIHKSVVTGNQSVENGGGVHLGYFSAVPVLTAISSSLVNNQADAAGVSGGGGGALFNQNGTADLQVCRIWGNTAAYGSGIAAVAGITTAQNNWWGCNEGPGADPSHGCDALAGPVDADPWLVFHLLTEHSAVAVNQPAVFLGDLTGNSDLQDTTSLGTLRDGVPIAFTALSGGVLQSADTVLTQGQAEAILLAADSPGVAQVESVIDSETQTASLTIVDLRWTLSPTTVELPEGVVHTVTFTLTLDGAAFAGVPVEFSILSGPNAPASSSETTGPQGQAVFSYAGTGGIGADVIKARGEAAGAPFEAIAVVNWVPTPPSAWLLF